MVQGDLKSGPGFGRLGLSLAQIAAFLEVAPGLEDFSAPWESKVLAVTTDSRAGCPGDLFIALKGEHFDGHDFVSSALKAGVLAAVVNKDSPAASLDGPLIRVSDTLEALGQLALAVRRLVKPKLAAVTGSVGKTTVKEILKSIFTCSAAKGETSRLGEDTSDDPDGPRVVTTFGNYNNSVGLPLTLLSMGPKTRLVAAELGANHLGEIEALTKICEPDVGLVTALGAAHMEYFGSLERVAQAKGELYLGLKEDAVAAINIHEPELVKIAQKFLGRKVFFGFKASGADLEVEKVKDMGVMGQRLCFSGPMVGKSPLTLDLSLAGDHNALNAAAAAIVARILGISWVDIASGLTETSAAPGRLKITKSPQGIWVIDDSYNANPTSMTAALDFLAGLEGPRAAILGDMLELGDNSQKWHKEIGQKASTANLTRLAVVGKLAKTIGEAAIEAGFVEEKVGFFEDPQKAAQWLIQGLSQEMQPELSVLIKGSRVIGLERAVSVFFTNTQPAVDTGVQRNG